MGVAEDHGFTHQVLTWFWKQGSQRSGVFALPRESWLDSLYRIHQQAGATRRATAWPRRQVVWRGLASAAPSALVGTAIDGDAGDPRSALHWEGGPPCSFLPGTENSARSRGATGLTLAAVRPGGEPASVALACRLLPGAATAGAAVHGVRDPAHPVELVLADPLDLWRAIARGCASECRPGGDAADASAPVCPPEGWSADDLLNLLRRHAGASVGARARESREAWELLHDLCGLLEELTGAGVRRFSRLKGDPAGSRALRQAILGAAPPTGTGPNALHFDLARAYAFAADVLWDGHAVISDYHQTLVEAARRLRQDWGDRPVLCDLETASFLRDPDSFPTFLRPLPGRPTPGDLRIHRRLPYLGWEDRGDHVVIDASGSRPNRLVAGPEDFAVLQGLIWEMLVPVDLAQLADGPFRSLFERADLLELPAIEAGIHAADLIDLERMTCIRAGERPADGFFGERDEPHQFFLRLLRQGKSAALLHSRLAVSDVAAVCLVQDLGGSAPDGAACREATAAWRDPRSAGEPGLPSLELVLSGWTAPGTADPNRGKLDWLGELAASNQPGAFAVGRPGASAASTEVAPATADIEALLQGDPNLHRLFAEGPGRASLEAMLAGERNGGASFLFSALAARIDQMPPRAEVLRQQEEAIANALAGLMEQSGLLPYAAAHDPRRESLAKYRSALESACASADDTGRRSIDAALRRALDVDPRDLAPLPSDPGAISTEFVAGQARRWCETRSAAVAALEAAGVGERAGFSRAMHALAESAQPDFAGAAEWLRELVANRAAAAAEGRDLRRPLALLLANLLFGAPASAGAGSDAGAIGQSGGDPAGFVGRLCGEHGRLATLAERAIPRPVRPDQPGDEELVALAQQSHPHLVPGITPS